MSDELYASLKVDRDVSIYKQQIEDIEHIAETLKKEEPKVKIFGSPKVSDELDLKNS